MLYKREGDYKIKDTLFCLVDFCPALYLKVLCWIIKYYLTKFCILFEWKNLFVKFEIGESIEVLMS